jgi:hypothetical protein
VKSHAEATHSDASGLPSGSVSVNWFQPGDDSASITRFARKFQSPGDPGTLLVHASDPFAIGERSIATPPGTSYNANGAGTVMIGGKKVMGDSSILEYQGTGFLPSLGAWIGVWTDFSSVTASPGDPQPTVGDGQMAQYYTTWF